MKSIYIRVYIYILDVHHEEDKEMKDKKKRWKIEHDEIVGKYN